MGDLGSLIRRHLRPWTSDGLWSADHRPSLPSRREPEKSSHVTWSTWSHGRARWHPMMVLRTLITLSYHWCATP